MLKLYCWLALLWACLPALASTPPDISFGKVNLSELEMTHYSLDSTAHAVVLGDFGRSHFEYNSISGLQVVFTRHTRIKIFSSEGYDWSDVYVNLYREGLSQEAISQIKGYTYNLENGKVVKTKLKNNGKFEEKVTDHLSRTKFTLPNVKAGSVIEYTYRVSSDFLSNLRDWQFQSSIPTVWSEYKVEIPEYFRYKQLSLGYHPLVVHEQSSSSGSFMISYKERSGHSVSKTEMGQDILNFTQQTYRWAAQDVPALTEEPYITTMSDYTSQITFELANVQIPGETYKDYSSTWEKIDQQLLEDESFGKLFTRTSAVRETVATLTADASSQSEKMIRIFNYVRDHIKWNEQNRFTSDQSLKKTLSEKSGTSADINLLLIAMLREAGMSAHPVVLSTRDHGMIRPSFPRINQFNYVIAMAQLDSTAHLLDATEVTCPYNVLPVRCLNGKGRVVGSSLSDKWIELQSTKRSSKVVLAMLSLQDGGLQGTISSSHAKHDAMRLRKKIASYSSVDNYIADIKQSQPGIQHYQLEAVEEKDQAVRVSMNVTLTDGVQQAGPRVYLNPFAHQAVQENPFKAEVRTYPVDYAYPFSETYTAHFTIPEEYTIDELPENLSIALPNQGGRYIFTMNVQGNILQVSSKLDIMKARFYAQEYASLRDFYRQMIEKQSEQIVLVKQ